MSYSKAKRKVKLKLNNILEDIDDNKDDNDIINNYKDINKILDNLKKKDLKWLEYIFKIIDKIDNFNNEDNFLKIFPKKEDVNILKYIFNNITNKIKELNLVDIDNFDINKKTSLKQHQIDALNTCINILNNNNKLIGIINMIMGAGKTLIELLLIELFCKNYITKDNRNGSIILYISSRKNILEDIFFVGNNKLTDYEKNFKLDITKTFNIINLTGDKNSKTLDINSLSKNKCNLIVVNSQYLQSIKKNKEYFKVILDKIKLVVFDECHNTSAFKVYDFLQEIKNNNYNLSLVGFSATPSRTTKKAKEYLCKLFSINDNLKIIYEYDLFKGIIDNVVLPFKIINRNVKAKEVKRNNEDIEEDNENNKEVIKYETDILDSHDIIQTIFNSEDINNLPNKKGIGWCSSIQSANEWYKLLKAMFSNWKFYISHSKIDNNDYEIFCKRNKNTFLICVNRCTEGCDINNIDFAIILDPVNNRDIVRTLQMYGRIMRLSLNKIHALIFELCLNKNNSDAIALKIIHYYNVLLQLTKSEKQDYYDELIKIFVNTFYDDINKKLTIKLDDNDEHNCVFIFDDKIDDWSKIKDKVDKKIKDIINDENIKLKLEYDKLKDRIIKLKIKNKEDYKKYAIENKIEDKPEDKYKDYGWINYYDFLGKDIGKYPKDLNKLKDICKIKKINNSKIYHKNINKYNLPEMPEELYKELINRDNLFETKEMLFR
jgi:superfamily II DNA or RNA helicase